MRNLWVSSITWSLLATFALAQRSHVGTVDAVWTNTTGVGGAALDVRVHYPSLYGGIGSPMVPAASPSGYAVVVFLHGYGLLGTDYADLGDQLAQSGFIAVMLNTAQYSYSEMEGDTRAMLVAIGNANNEPGGFFENAFDVSKVGLMGHSMGGAVIAYVLNADPSLPTSNPGYKCGLCLAPVNPALAVAGGTVVNVPIGMVSGAGDTLTPPAMHATPFYNSLEPTEGLKFHYKMDAGCDHMNIAGLSSANPGVFERSYKIAGGFFGQFLGGTSTGLESVLGVEGLSDPYLLDIESDTVVPQSWASAALTIGGQTRVSVAAEDGYAGLIAAATISAPTSTMVGTLLLDPATAFSLAETFIVGERLDVIISVPNAPALVGSPFAVQGGGATLTNPFRLGSALSFEIEG
jgi:dienelactone hydrolase